MIVGVRSGPARLLAALALLHLLHGVASSAAVRPHPRLADLYREWLEGIEPIASPAERRLFAALSSDIERERFIEAFWLRRDELQQQRFHDNQEAAKELLLRARDQRRVVLLAGKPSSLDRFFDCESVLRRVEIWHYDAWQQRWAIDVGEHPASFVFVQTRDFDPRSARLWSRSDPSAAGFAERATALDIAVRAAARAKCVEPAVANSLLDTLDRAIDFPALPERFGWTVPDGAPEVRLGGRRFGTARLALDYPGRQSRLQILRGNVSIPVDALTSLAGEQLFDRVVLVGDLYHGGHFFEAFRVVHLLAGAPPRSGSVELDFYRRLPAGESRLELRVTNSRGRVLLREGRELDVPLQETEAEPPAGRRSGFLPLTRSEVVELTTLPRVELLPPAGISPSDRVQVEAVTTGGPIAAVELFSDDHPAGRDDAPPYLFQVDLTRPSHRLRAVAVDLGGRPLDADEQVIHRRSPPLHVVFGDPQQLSTESFALPVRLEIPDGEQLAVLECFVNDRQTAVHGERSCPIPAPPYSQLTFARAVAHLESGETAEDVRFLSAVAAESVDVRLGELLVSVLDPNGRPVSGLGAADFWILQGEEKRPPTSVMPIDRLPLSVAVLMDTSSSMGRRVQLAAESAQRFFESVLAPGDQASLLSFGDDVRQRVAFTGDVELLRYGALGARAHGTTRLYDGMVYSAASFAGLPGRRALVVLTDGADTDSDFQAPQVLDAVQRARVMVFPIALGGLDEATLGVLGELAQRTGGQLFRASAVAELDATYRTIEQLLRSQYRILYQPDEAMDGRGDVDVVLRHADLRALVSQGGRR